LLPLVGDPDQVAVGVVALLGAVRVRGHRAGAALCHGDHARDGQGQAEGHVALGPEGDALERARVEGHALHGLAGVVEVEADARAPQREAGAGDVHALASVGRTAILGDEVHVGHRLLHAGGHVVVGVPEADALADREDGVVAVFHVVDHVVLPDGDLAHRRAAAGAAGAAA